MQSNMDRNAYVRSTSLTNLTRKNCTSKHKTKRYRPMGHISFSDFIPGIKTIKSNISSREKSWHHTITHTQSPATCCFWRKFFRYFSNFWSTFRNYNCAISRCNKCFYYVHHDVAKCFNTFHQMYGTKEWCSLLKNIFTVEKDATKRANFLEISLDKNDQTLFAV